MLHNYIKTALRNLSRHRFFSFITIFGLAIGMSISMIIIMLVADQMMYDRYNTKRDRIYRVNSIVIEKDGAEHDEAATTTLPLKQELIENVTGIEKGVRIMEGFGNHWMELELNQNVNIPVAGYFADPEVLDFFEYELEYGDSRTALVEPFSVVLTRKAANKLFRKENPVGETIKVGDSSLYKVTGVLRETDRKSHIVFDALASLSSVKNPSDDRGKRLVDWYDANAGWVYILLAEGKTPADLQPLLNRIQARHFTSLTNPDTQRKVRYALQNLMKITPGPFINNAIGPSLPWLFVYFFVGLAAMVMLTSCFNFTNLSIARSLTRAREIGIRKVTGAMRWQIFLQFLSESVIVSLFSLLLAFVFLTLLKPLLLQLSFARVMKWDLEANYYVYGIFFLFALLTGLFAGIFPAAVISGFQPIKVLKNLSTMKLFSNMGLRKALLVTQFTFSLLFILTVIVVFSQLKLFLRADHGFSMENKIIVQLNGMPPEALKNELLKFGNVESVSAASHIPAAGVSYGAAFKKSLDERDWTILNYFSVDEDYLKNIDVHMVSGRFFTAGDGPSKKNFIVLNEEAVKAFQFNGEANAVGQEIIRQEDSTRLQVIGVVKSYNHQMLMQKREPMALLYNPAQFNLLQVKYSGSYLRAGETVDTAWAKINPAVKVDYKDFSAEVHKLYNVLFGDLVNILSLIAFLAVAISCLGLLGMATYTTETRIKEISIRKVLGSSDGAIIYLLSKGFFAILLMAIAIAVPAAYVLNTFWLEKLAYHVTVSMPMVLSGVLILILFGALTVGSQTWRAVFVKPVENLKGE